MIIFDLDGTLADCSHRQHFVVKPKQPECTCDPDSYGYDGQSCAVYDYNEWKPDWESFYQACVKDVLIESTGKVYKHAVYSVLSEHVHIWSGRCESQREKTLNWIINNLYWENANKQYLSETLKMRPIGDETPEHNLKEKWLDEYCNSTKYCKYTLSREKCQVDYVFDSDPDSIAMWRKRGIFVFDVSQGKGGVDAT